MMLRMLVLSLAVVGALACTVALAQTRSGSAVGDTAKPLAHDGLRPDHQRMFCGDPDNDIDVTYSAAVSAEIDALLSRESGPTRTVAAALAEMHERYCSAPIRSAT